MKLVLSHSHSLVLHADNFVETEFFLSHDARGLEGDKTTVLFSFQKSFSPRKGVRRFSVRGKLASRYVGSFKVIEHVGIVEHKLELPPQLYYMHKVFHVSQLKKVYLISHKS